MLIVNTEQFFSNIGYYQTEKILVQKSSEDTLVFIVLKKQVYLRQLKHTQSHEIKVSSGVLSKF